MEKYAKNINIPCKFVGYSKQATLWKAVQSDLHGGKTSKKKMKAMVC